MKEITASNFNYSEYKESCLEQSCNLFFKNENDFDKLKSKMVRVYEIQKLVSDPLCRNSDELLQELYADLSEMTEEDLCDEAIIFAHLHSIFNNVSLEGFLNSEFNFGLDDDMLKALNKFKAKSD